MTHLAIHAAALLVMGLAVGLPGYALERVCIGRSLDDDDALRPLARWVLGLLFWTVALFALASTGLLRTSAVLAVAALGAAAGAWARLRIPRDPPAEGGSQGGDESAGGGSTVAGWILGFTVVATLLVPFLLAIGPTVSWDGSAYHLMLPRLYLEHGGFRPVEMNVYAAWPQAVELLFAPALAAGGPPFAKLVHFGFGLLVLFGLRTAARRSGLRPWAGWLAMVLFLANGVVLYELRVAYVDLAHAFFLLAAFLFLGAARRDAESRPALLVLAGLAAGLMAGVKITGIAGAALLLALWLPELVRRGRRRRDLGELALRYGLPVALLWLPWLVRSAVLTGNPVYPLAFGAFGGPDWSHELGQRFADWQRGLGMGRGAVDYILLLPRVILVSGQGYDRFDGELGRFWILALPLAVAFVRSSPLIRRCLGISGLYFVYWGLSSQQARFLVPILPLVALASAAALQSLLARLRPPAVGRGKGPVASALALIVPVALAAAPGMALVVAHGDLLRSARQHLAIYGDPRFDAAEAAAPAGVWRAVDALPAGARVLMLNTNQGFHCRREYLADSFFEASQVAQWLAPAENVGALVTRLRARGVTHLLWANRDWGIAYPEPLLRLLRSPSGVRPLYQAPDQRHLLFELVGGGVSPDPGPSPGRGAGG